MIMMAVVNALVVCTTLNDYDNDKENLGRMVVVVFVVSFSSPSTKKSEMLADKLTVALLM